MFIKLTQKNHAGTGAYYIGSGAYFGIPFEQVGEELIAEVDEKAVESLIKAKLVSKVSTAALKDLKEEA